MRFDPTGHRIAYTLGYGDPAASRRLRIVVADRTGIGLTELPGGHEPEWSGTDTLYARSLDGSHADHVGGGFTLHLRGANDGDLSAAAGVVAVAADRAHGVTVTGPSFGQTYAGTFEPSLSQGHTLALRDLASGSLRLERLPGCRDAAATLPSLGPGTRARWGSQTVVFDTVPFGRVLGRVTPDQVTIDVSIPGRTCTHPVALWTGTVLYVGIVLDEGELVLAEWGSLTRHEARGWRVGVSGGSAFDWDLANSADGPLVAWLTPEGTLATAIVNVSAPPVFLGIEPPEPPPDPAPIDPPDPPDPPPTGGDDMTAADIRRYVAELGNDLLFGAVQRYHGDVLPRDRPMDGAIKSEAWTEGDPDFWTGDVTTGGANGFFCRSYVSEYLIARDTGRTAAQASGDGYDAAIKAYNHAVNPPPTPPPGAVKGPIGVVERDFTVG